MLLVGISGRDVTGATRGAAGDARNNTIGDTVGGARIRAAGVATGGTVGYIELVTTEQEDTISLYVY